MLEAREAGGYMLDAIYCVYYVLCHATPHPYSECKYMKAHVGAGFLE